jgi:hypothetical protein
LLSIWLLCLLAVSFLKVEVLQGPGVMIINTGKGAPASLPDWHHYICIGQTEKICKSWVFDSIMSVASFGPRHPDFVPHFCGAHDGLT